MHYDSTGLPLRVKLMEETGAGDASAVCGPVHLPQHPEPDALLGVLQWPCLLADASAASVTRNLSLEWQTAHSPP